MANGIMVVGGNANPELTAAICRELGIPQGRLTIKTFADGEIYPQLLDNVRGCDVFVVQPTCKPVNDNLMELVLIADALKRASAKRITAVLPYYGYARQDRKDKPRVPISAKAVANMLEGAKVKRILSLDLHSPSIQGFFDIPVDHLYALPVVLDYLNGQSLNNLTIVSPDAGGVERARVMARKLKADLAIIDKRRIDANVAEVMNVIGDVVGRDCLIVDDMIDTAGTLVKGANALMAKGAASVRAVATHGIFSYDRKEDISALAKIEASSLTEVIVTDSIPQDVNLQHSTKLKVLSVAGLMAKAIQSIHEQTSVSTLFV